MPGTLTPIKSAMLSHTLDLPLKSVDLLANDTPIGFYLRLSRSSGTNATAQTLQVAPLPREAGQEILMLRQFNLKAALMGTGSLGEYVQDQCGAIDDLDIESLLNISLLDR
jgi:hypothetical protein